MLASDRPVAFIPARGGSKRLRRKNIHPFLGRPMIGWTIAAARNSGLFGDVVVSTEDEEIADVARGEGAKILMRPGDLASDTAGLVDVLRHTIASEPGFPEVFCLLLANCPLRTAADVSDCYAAFEASGAPAMLSVVDFGWTPPFRALRVSDTGLEFIFSEGLKKSQEYPETVCPSGAIYWARSVALSQAASLYVEGLRPFRMPWHRAVDIDTEDDLKLAACLAFAERHGFSFDEAVA